MESDRYPTIRFELARVSPRAEQGDTVLVDLQGEFPDSRRGTHGINPGHRGSRRGRNPGPRRDRDEGLPDRWTCIAAGLN